MFVLALVCAVLVSQSSSLSPGEEQAIDALKRTYPALLTQPGWMLPSSKACSYAGITCDDTQSHVLNMYVVFPFSLSLGRTNLSLDN